MKKLVLFFLVIVGLQCFGQSVTRVKRISRKAIHVWGEDFEGVLFTKKYKPRDSVMSADFTPTIQEVELAEACLRKKLDTLVTVERFVSYDGKLDTATDEGHRVADYLNYYVRQYLGYINKKGEKILFVDCFYRYSHVYKDKKDWQSRLVFVYDGGRAFWHVKVNLNTEQLFGLYINGI